MNGSMNNFIVGEFDFGRIAAHERDTTETHNELMGSSLQGERRGWKGSERRRKDNQSPNQSPSVEPAPLCACGRFRQPRTPSDGVCLEDVWLGRRERGYEHNHWVTH
eukprot:GHVU01032239.1.p1 GENE.GHVU01032239.1~~GHVU01032239.1.p1  ORF type:complete len:107 (+),score=10.16 GHVU01032239.1:169-489(+)